MEAIILTFGLIAALTFFSASETFWPLHFIPHPFQQRRPAMKRNPSKNWILLICPPE